MGQVFNGIRTRLCTVPTRNAGPMRWLRLAEAIPVIVSKTAEPGRRGGI